MNVRVQCANVAAVPSTLRVTEEPLPRTSTGKVDRKHITATMELVS